MIEFNKYIYYKNRGDKKERLRMLLVKSFKVSRVLVSCVVVVVVIYEQSCAPAPPFHLTKRPFEIELQ